MYVIFKLIMNAYNLLTKSRYARISDEAGKSDL